MAVRLLCLLVIGARGLQGFELPGTTAQGYPLFVHSPYTSWWLRGGDPTISDVWHVKQDKRAGMSAMIRLGNVSYRLLGSECTPGVGPFPHFTDATVHPTRTVFSYLGLGVRLNLTFAKPVFLEDLRSHTPITFVYFDVASTDGTVRDVEFFFETPGQMATDKDSQTVAWARDEWSSPASPHISMNIGVAAQNPFALTDYWVDPRQPAEHIDWGQAHLTLPYAASANASYNASSWMGSSNLARSTFAVTGDLPHGDDLAMPEPACGNVTSGYYVCSCGIFPRMRGGNDYPTETFDDPIPGDLWPGLAAAFRLGAVASSPRRATALISYDDLGFSTRFFGQVLPEIWRVGNRRSDRAASTTVEEEQHHGKSFREMIMEASDGAAAAIASCKRYDQQLVDTFYAVGGEDFAVLAAAGYRAEMGWVTYAWFNGTLQDAGSDKVSRTEPGSAGAISFVKGIGSSGDTGTIDDNYRSIWPYIWGNPEALNAMQRPLNLFNDHQTYDAALPYPRNVSFPFNYSAHYLGQYPVAELQCWNKATKWEPDDMFLCEPMPLEATADVIQVTVHAAKAMNSSRAARPFLRTLLRLSDYLVDNGLYPATQLTTDDYMGAHTNNTNLAVKAIIGIGAFAQLCDLLVAEHYSGASLASGAGVDWALKAAHYHAVAKDYAAIWTRQTAGGLLGGHVSSYGANGTFSLKYNLVFDRVLGTSLFTKPIQTECRVFRTLQRIYRLNNGLPFGGDAASLNESNVTGVFNQVNSWTAWFAPLCGDDMARPIYKSWRRLQETSWNRTTGLCTEGLGFSNCRLDLSRSSGGQQGGGDGVLRPKAARCGEVLRHFSCHSRSGGRAGRGGAGSLMLRPTRCGMSCGWGGSLWTPLVLQKYGVPT